MYKRINVLVPVIPFTISRHRVGCVKGCVLCSLCDDAAHLQKLMSDKKCAQEKKSEMDSVITQVSHALEFPRHFIQLESNEVRSESKSVFKTASLRRMT